MAQGGSGNGHYGGNAEIYMDVGEAMGKAMVELLKDQVRNEPSDARCATRTDQANGYTTCNTEQYDQKQHRV